MSELEVFHYLTGRLLFSENMSQSYYRLELGAIGEGEFADLTPVEIERNFIKWSGLNLLHDGREVQIDALWLGRAGIYHFEIKNYMGDYILQDGKWFKRGGSEIESPLYQMQRAHVILKKLLQKHQLNLPVHSYLIFMHPDFHLYQSNYQLPIYLRSQLKRLFSEIIGQSSQVIFSQNQVAKVIEQHRIAKSKYAVRPTFTYEQVRKGLRCQVCRGKQYF